MMGYENLSYLDGLFIDFDLKCNKCRDANNFLTHKLRDSVNNKVKRNNDKAKKLEKKEEELIKKKDLHKLQVYTVCIILIFSIVVFLVSFTIIILCGLGVLNATTNDSIEGLLKIIMGGSAVSSGVPFIWLFKKK